MLHVAACISRQSPADSVAVRCVRLVCWRCWLGYDGLSLDANPDYKLSRCGSCGDTRITARSAWIGLCGCGGRFCPEPLPRCPGCKAQPLSWLCWFSDKVLPHQVFGADRC